MVRDAVNIAQQQFSNLFSLVPPEAVKQMLGSHEKKMFL
jgi:hypothetical protein